MVAPGWGAGDPGVGRIWTGQRLGYRLFLVDALGRYAVDLLAASRPRTGHEAASPHIHSQHAQRS